MSWACHTALQELVIIGSVNGLPPIQPQASNMTYVRYNLSIMMDGNLMSVTVNRWTNLT